MREEDWDDDEYWWEEPEVLHSDSPTLGEAAARMPFPVFAPARHPENTRMEVSAVWEPYPLMTIRFKEKSTRVLKLTLEEARYLGPPPGSIGTDHRGRRLFSCCIPTVGHIFRKPSPKELRKRGVQLYDHRLHDVYVDLDGTNVHVSSDAFGINDLIEIAATLRRVQPQGA